MRKNNGITLIALIITIIIMLILVAVSISILINSGLIGKAKEGAQKTKTAYEQEQRLGDSLNINGVMYNSIDEFIGDLSGSREIHNWQREGDTLTCNHCNATFTIGQTVNYTAGGIETSSISADASGVTEAKADNKSWANSYGESQTISRDAETTWVVLGREDTNKDGNYETLLLTTSKRTTDKIRLYGASAYNNWVSECNRIAKDLYGNEARGMTIEDVNQCFQYTPAGAMYYENGVCLTTGNLTTKLNELSTWNDTKSNGTLTPDGANTEEALGNYELNGYWYSIPGDNMYITDDADSSNTSHTVTAIEKELIFGNTHYWLASRGLYSHPDGAGFGPGAVTFSMAESYSRMYFSSGYVYDESLGFRAVIPLTNEVPTTGT